MTEKTHATKAGPASYRLGLATPIDDGFPDSSDYENNYRSVRRSAVKVIDSNELSGVRRLSDLPQSQTYHPLKVRFWQALGLAR